MFYLGCQPIAGSYGVTLLLSAFVKAAGGGQAKTGLIYWCGEFGAAGALALSGRLAERAGAAWYAALGTVLHAAATHHAERRRAARGCLPGCG